MDESEAESRGEPEDDGVSTAKAECDSAGQREFTEWLANGGLPDLADNEIMDRAWH